MRTQDPVILEDASSQNLFSADPYLAPHRARSILCLPLINQGNLIGVLYLENNLAPRVFGPARVAVLKLLASQAAMSLENTRLYRDLAKREAKIRRLVDANIVGILIWDLDGTILEANDALLRIAGYEREDLVSGRLRWTDLAAAQWGGRNLQELAAEIQRTGSLQPFEWEYLRKDGSRVPVLVGAAIFEGENQGVAFVLDLTERKRAEEELRRSRAYLAEAQKVSHTGSWVWNNVTREIVYWSEECFRIHGRDPAQSPPALEQILADMHPDDVPGVAKKLEKALSEGGEWEGEYRLVNFADGPRTVRSIGHPVPDRSGRVVDYVGIVADITKQKHAEQELRKSELERERAEQALGEAREKLVQASKIASLAELSASIAHEINQPLQAIVANGHASLRWLDATPPNIEKAIRTAERVVRDGNAAAEVVSRIRALFNRTAPAKVDLDINKLILQVRGLMADEIQGAGVSLATELGEDLPRTRADAVQIQQVIVNLMRNGIEAMAGARPKPLLIRSRRSAGHVVVDVRDQGMGLVDPDKIFEPFVSTKETGMGMGLTICRSIIEAHVGNIRVVHNDGPGVTFSFSLPVEA